MKFLVLLTFAVVFLTVFTRSEEESEEHVVDDEGEYAQALSSAMQLNSNNGDINNVKGKIWVFWNLRLEKNNSFEKS